MPSRASGMKRWFVAAVGAIGLGALLERRRRSRQAAVRTSSQADELRARLAESRAAEEASPTHEAAPDEPSEATAAETTEADEPPEATEADEPPEATEVDEPPEAEHGEASEVEARRVDVHERARRAIDDLA